MPIRTSIHLPDAITAILGDPPEPSLSGRIAGIVSAYAQLCEAAGVGTGMDEAGALLSAVVRYREIVRLAMPTLTVAEWSLLADVLNGTLLDAEPGGPDLARYLWAEVADSGPDGMAKKWSVDLPALAARLKALDYPAQCAVLEVVRAFWASPRLNLEPIPELLAGAGAKIAPA